MTIGDSITKIYADKLLYDELVASNHPDFEGKEILIDSMLPERTFYCTDSKYAYYGMQMFDRRQFDALLGTKL